MRSGKPTTDVITSPRNRFEFDILSRANGFVIPIERSTIIATFEIMHAPEQTYIQSMESLHVMEPCFQDV